MQETFPHHCSESSPGDRSLLLPPTPEVRCLGECEPDDDKDISKMLSIATYGKRGDNNVNECPI